MAGGMYLGKLPWQRSYGSGVCPPLSPRAAIADKQGMRYLAMTVFLCFATCLSGQSPQLHEQISQLQKALNKEPRNEQLKQSMAMALSQRGAARHKVGKTRQAYGDFQAANRLFPNQEGILQSLGVLAQAQNRATDARRWMQRVLRLNANNTAALTVLGQLAAARDDVGKASKYLQQAQQQSGGGSQALQKMASKYGKQAQVEQSFVTDSRGNFRIQYQRGKVAGVEKAIQKVRSILEEAYSDLNRQLEARPGRAITAVIYNGEQYKSVRSTHAWARAYYDGKLRISLQDWPAGQTQLRRDLRHELTHAFLREIYPQTPLWLHEGYAQVLEGRSVLAARGGFRSGQEQLLKGAQFEENFNQSGDDSVVRRGYAQSLMAVGYLLRQGSKRQFRQLLAEVGRGAKSERALQVVYGFGLEKMLR